MVPESTETRVQEAVLEFTLGNYPDALEKLDAVINDDPGCFEAHLAKTEVLYAMENYEGALDAARAAEEIRADDVHLKTSLSRIWMRLGDKEKAEAYGAEAKMLSWKHEILSGEDSDAAAR